MPCHRSTQWGPDRITLGLRSDPIWSQRTSCPIGSARSWSTCVQCAYLVGCTLAQIGSPRMDWSPRCFHVLAMSLLHSLAHFLIPHVRCASSLCFSLLPCSLLVCDLLCAGIISASLLSVLLLARVRRESLRVFPTRPTANHLAWACWKRRRKQRQVENVLA